MAVVKKQYDVSGTVQTTGTGWTTIAQCTIAENASVMIKDIWVIGRDVAAGHTATYRAEHKAKRIAGTLTLVGSIVVLITFASGSDSFYTGLNTPTARILVDGDILKLQVTLPAATDTDWYGGFSAILN